MTRLDDAYANAPHIPGSEDYPPRWASEAAEFRAALGERAQLNLSYGPSERQAYDLFLPEAAAQGTLIFVHGGFWRAFDRTSWSHFAQGALARGWRVAMPSYDLCPSVRIPMITQQIAQAVCTIAYGQSGPLTLAGHSAGGHLVARMLDPGILPQAVLSRIRHCMPISPLCDLEPLIETAMNADFRLDMVTAQAESPLLQPQPETPVTVWVGAAERPAFLDQALWLAQHWECEHVVAPERHHFDVIDRLKDETSSMVARLTPEVA